MTVRIAMLLLVSIIPALADVTGRWSTVGDGVFVLHQNGNAVTGTIEGKLGEPTDKIVGNHSRKSNPVFRSA
ncbi:MAG: hypothetical protein ABI824_14640 [Acidobacteriota bacterium]